MTTNEMDSIRLDCLADPSFLFKFSIAADGKANCSVEGKNLILNTLRGGIDEARAINGHIPFCIKCNEPITELNMTADGMNKRWNCDKCGTSFLH